MVNEEIKIAPVDYLPRKFNKEGNKYLVHFVLCQQTV